MSWSAEEQCNNRSELSCRGWDKDGNRISLRGRSAVRVVVTGLSLETFKVARRNHGSISLDEYSTQEFFWVSPLFYWFHTLK
jgi:hypothetical protein|mmetsp:Transcript_44300/g.74576  ORF Transcript_44300/g.74576 Transcript_44300/m.74576 type:complete len:82 (+) Transcript_44300:845-1090(+)